VTYISEIPTPYRRPFLKKLSTHPEIDLTVLYLAAGQDDREWKDGDDLYDFEKVLPGFHWCTNREKGYFNRFNPSLFSYLSKEKCDVAVFGAYYVMSMMLGLHWARLRHLPYIMQCESHQLRSRKGWKVFLKDLLLSPLMKNAAAWLPLGTLAKKYLISYGAYPERCFFCPNTPDVDLLKEKSATFSDRQELKEKFSVAPEHRVILYVGRFIKIKRIDLLVKAYAELKKADNNISLVLAGSGPEEESLRKMTAELNLSDVSFPGFIQPENLPELYILADVMALPSDDEPWAVVVNEAMACGTPVIASDRVGASADLVSEGQTGYVFEAGSTDSLCGALKQFFEADIFKDKNSPACIKMAEDWGYSLCIDSFVKAAKSASL
jgi:glycosyltransferase involved in cell wall biosynthesis